MSSKEEVDSNFPFSNNDRKLKEYIDSVCSEMISPWVPKLLMDVFILTQYYEGQDIIKVTNKDCLHRVYFDPQKYPISNQFQGNGYDLLYKDLATSAIKQGYQIVQKGFYPVGGLTTNRFSCNRCIQYKGNIKFRKSTFFCQKIFHNDTRNTRGLIGREMCHLTITQRAIWKISNAFFL